MLSPTRHDGTPRVMITGLGALTCLGTGREALWHGILAEKSGFGRLTRFDPAALGLRARCAGEIHFDASAFADARQQRRLDRHSLMALAVAKMAFADAGLSAKINAPHPRWGVNMGTALAGIAEAEAQHTLFLKEGPKAIHPLLAIQIFGGASSSNISIEFGLTGPCATSSNSCASGTMAIGEAARMIRLGQADVMLAGASEAPLHPLTFSAFDRIHAMSASDDPARACRPFDARRDGFVMAEGAAVLLLESEAHARARGARIYGEIQGYASNSDAYHMTSSLPSGACAARCMLDALKDAGVPPGKVDYINAHGSSTLINDRNETAAIKLALGEHARRVAISGTKAYHGHPLGATGAIEAAICTLALDHQHIPPTLNWEEPDPACDLDYVPNHGRSARLNHILSNSFGFGGVNAVLVISRLD